MRKKINLNSGTIYFIGEKDPVSNLETEYIKIGLVKEADNRSSFDRKNEHQTGNPRLLDVKFESKVCAVEVIERILHKSFGLYMVGGEWFKFNDEQIKQAINLLVQYNDLLNKNRNLIEEVDILEKNFSNGTIRTSNTYIDNLFNEYKITKFKYDNISQILDEIKEKLFDLRKQYDEKLITKEIQPDEKITNTIIIQNKKSPQLFNLRKFQTEYPQLYNKFEIFILIFSNKFKIEKYKKNEFKLTDIDKNLNDYILAIQLKMNENQIFEFDELRVIQVTLEKLMEELDFCLSLLEYKIKKECGLFEGIQGICTWTRAEVKKVKFDEQRLKIEYPEIYEKYVFTKSLLESKRIGRSYINLGGHE